MPPASYGLATEAEARELAALMQRVYQGRSAMEAVGPRFREIGDAIADRNGVTDKDLALGGSTKAIKRHGGNAPMCVCLRSEMARFQRPGFNWVTL